MNSDDAIEHEDPTAQSTPRTMDNQALENIRWERELLQRERALLEREKQLMQQSMTTSMSPPVYVMNATIHSTPDYNPSLKNSLTATQWVKKMESLARTYRWDNDYLFQHAIDKLKGAAKRWFDGETDIEDWQQLKEGIVEGFPSYTDEADIHHELSTKRKRHEESYEDYIYDMKAIATRGNVSTSSIIKYIINGITDREVAKMLAMQQFSTIVELLERIKSYESTYKRQEIKKTYFSETNNTDRNKTDRPSSFRCYNCSEEGHKSMNCPKPQRRPRCAKCQRSGHVEANCGERTKSPTTVTKPSNVRTITTYEKSPLKDEFHKIVNIDGREVYAFIDLGSEVVTMRSEDAKRMNITFQPYQVKLLGFGNGSCETIGKRTLLITIDGVNIQTEVLLVPDTAQHEELLIGKNAFDKPGIRLIKEVGTLTIEYVEPEKKGIEKIKPRVYRIKRENIQANEELDHETTEQLTELINDYEDCFANGLADVGSTDLVTFKIELNKSTPIRSQPYRLPYHKRDKVTVMVKELLDAGIITETTSDYASPVLLVSKKTGDDRLCVDFRKLNAITKREQCPMPRIDEVIDELSGSRVFTTLDLASGYYQILVEEDSKPMTSFVTTDAQYVFNRLPFGVVNGPSVFCRLMTKIKTMVPRGTFSHYMDDIVVASRTNEENLTNLRTLFDAIRKTGLTFKLKKCVFLEKQIDFLGYEINKEGIRPGKIKTNAVENFKQPENVHEVRQFLGLTGFFRKFVEKYSIIAKPLTMLTREDQPFTWGSAQEKAFRELKTTLTTRPILELYRRECESEIHTDASKIGIAGILLQRHDNQLKPIAYYSRQTTVLESRYHSYELETLAVVMSLERFRTYILGKPVKVVTDCNSLKTITTKTELNARIARWSLKLQEYDIQLEHRAGIRMQHVDALSRNPTEPALEPEVAGIVMSVHIDESDWLLTMQLQDTHLKEIRTILNATPQTNDERQIHNDYMIHDNRICRKVGEKRLWVVPKTVISKVIRGSHDDMGHFGLEKTMEHLQRYVWFPRMRKKIKNYIASCIECAYHKIPGGRREGTMHNITRVAVPFHTIHIDHLGPFLKSIRGNTYVLALIDNFTKYCVLKAVKNTKTNPVCVFLEETTKTFGCPARIISDRGTAFTAKEFERFCIDNQIQHVKNATATPRANGQVERLNRTILTAITTLNDDENGENWDKHLKDIQFSLNCLRNKTTGRSPHELIFDYHPRNALKNRIVLALTEEGEVGSGETTQVRRDESLTNIEMHQRRQKEQFEKGRKTPRKYQEDDLVLIRNEAVATGESRKLEPKYKGPYLVSKVLGHDRYLLSDIPGAQRTQRSFNSTFASDRMKPWCGMGEVDKESEDEEDKPYEDEETEREKENLEAHEPADGDEDDTMWQSGRAVGNGRGDPKSPEEESRCVCAKRTRRPPQRLDDYYTY